VLGLGVCERCAETLELVDRQGLLDHPEKHSLFETDVALEALAEHAQLGRIGIRARFQIQRAATEIDVLGQNPNDFRWPRCASFRRGYPGSRRRLQER
jgi:hypothetical protein